MQPRWRFIAEYSGFQIVWFSCAIGAARDSNVPGVVATFLFLMLALFARRWSYREIAIVLASGLIGVIAETSLAATGMIRYGAAGGVLAPPWIIALWFAFGATVSTTAQLLRGSTIIKSAALGLVFGPLAYAAGERIGALIVTGATMQAYAVVALIWTIALPALLSLQAVINRPGTVT